MRTVLSRTTCWILKRKHSFRSKKVNEPWCYSTVQYSTNERAVELQGTLGTLTKRGRIDDQVREETRSLSIIKGLQGSLRGWGQFLRHCCSRRRRTGQSTEITVGGLNQGRELLSATRTPIRKHSLNPRRPGYHRDVDVDSLQTFKFA